jgi:hypothetical protein
VDGPDGAEGAAEPWQLQPLSTVDSPLMFKSGGPPDDAKTCAVSSNMREITSSERVAYARMATPVFILDLWALHNGCSQAPPWGSPALSLTVLSKKDASKIFHS